MTDMDHRTVFAAVERAYRLPPLYRYAMRRADRLSGLAPALASAHLDREAAQIAELAARWRGIAGEVKAGRRE